jgi:aspartyl/asparaginyl-tRNA synthetase
MKELLSEYKDNEVRADAKFKDKLIVVGGAVREVKKDILDHVYVKVGDHERTGTQALVEIPAVQCFPKDDQIAKAASLSKGDLVAVRGHVEGLMMNVLIKDCEIKTKADLKDKP